jgi:hypothetical protein
MGPALSWGRAMLYLLGLLLAAAIAELFDIG